MSHTCIFYEWWYNFDNKKGRKKNISINKEGESWIVTFCVNTKNEVFFGFYF